MEIALRSIATSGSELYIIMGGSGSIGTIPQTCAPPGRCINIPSQIWKVAIVLPSGDNDVSRVNTSTRAIAVITPNTQSALSDWTQYRVSVDEVEELTGFDFFSNVPVEIQNVIESRVDGVVPASTIKFNSATVSVNEGAANQVGSSVASLTVNRAGANLATPASVEYALRDVTATQARDYTIGSGVINFAAGETTKTVDVIITDDDYVEGNETLRVELSNVKGSAFDLPNHAVVTITDNDTIAPTINSINVNRFFARQNYHDFLGRVPDQGGIDFWTGELDSQCGTDPACNARRVGVSNAFFFELEYQQTGAYTYRLYRAAYGNTQPFANSLGDMDSNPYCTANPNNCQLIRAAHVPSYEKFASDRARLNASQLTTTQLALATAFAQRNEFKARYPLSQTAEQYVDALLATIQSASNANLTSQRAALISLYNGAGNSAAGRGAVLYRLAEDSLAMNPINNRPFIDAEYNRAFVTTQYFGYLRRDADLPGLNFWLSVVNQFPLRSPTGQNGMVCAFITSAEYQLRFSSVVTRTNTLCN